MGDCGPYLTRHETANTPCLDAVLGRHELSSVLPSATSPLKVKDVKTEFITYQTFQGYCLSLLLRDVYSINSFQRRYLVGTIYFNIFNFVLQQLHYKVKSTFWYLPSPGSLVEARPVCKLDAHFEGMMPKMVRAILNKFKGLLG